MQSERLRSRRMPFSGYGPSREFLMSEFTIKEESNDLIQLATTRGWSISNFSFSLPKRKKQSFWGECLITKETPSLQGTSSIQTLHSKP